MSYAELALAAPGTTSSGIALAERDLRARRNSKWAVAPDVLPAFIAEMDFKIAAPIQEAIEHVVHTQDYGYPHRDGGKLERVVADVFAARMKSRFNWSADPELVSVVSNPVQASACSVAAFSEPGDEILLHLPSYPPLQKIIHELERQLVPIPMSDNGERFVFDLAELPASTRGKLLLLCNPHNPTGRAFTRDELLAVGKYAIDHDLIVVSDEIHADIVFSGHQHIPFAALAQELAERTITLASASKGFNLPGLRCAVMHFGTPALKDRFTRRFPSRLLGSTNILGMEATIAAWTKGDAWLAAVLRTLDENRKRVATFVAGIPGLTMRLPESTYLGWIDCSGLKLEESAFQFFLERARVKFSPGETFQPDLTSFVRLNFATSDVILAAIGSRMASAVASATT